VLLHLEFLKLITENCSWVLLCIRRFQLRFSSRRWALLTVTFFADFLGSAKAGIVAIGHGRFLLNLSFTCIWASCCINWSLDIYQVITHYNPYHWPKICLSWSDLTFYPTAVFLHTTSSSVTVFKSSKPTHTVKRSNMVRPVWRIAPTVSTHPPTGAGPDNFIAHFSTILLPAQWQRKTQSC
jgi:hypothetical protein